MNGQITSEKIFKNLDEQVQIFKDKGLTIENNEITKKKLLRENYFFINGYRYLFMESRVNKRFVKGSTFDELYATFKFDRNLRNLVFKNILMIENNIKSIISYQLSKKYGYKEDNYLDEKNFTNDPLQVRQVKDVLNKVRRQIRVNSQKHSATQHYANNYGYIPMWVLVKVLSFGLVSELYNILRDEDQKHINNCYRINTENFSIYLSVLSNYRNLCAHEDIMYDYRTQKVILDNPIHKYLNIPVSDGEYIYGKNDLCALFMIFKFMLDDSEYQTFMNDVKKEIENLDAIVNSVPLNRILNHMGLPDNWQSILDYKLEEKCVMDDYYK